MESKYTRHRVDGRRSDRRCWRVVAQPLRAERSRSDASARRAPTSAVAAQKTYVAPGDLDEYYMFSSGGHSGQVYVYGLPSMRHLVDHSRLHALPRHRLRLRRRHEEDAGRPDLGRRAPSGAVGDQRRLRRPLALHQRDERPRRAHRPARLQDQADLRARSPNVSGNHGSSFVTPNTEYTMMASRFSIPIPKGTYAPIDKYATDYKGVVAAHQDRSEERRDVARLGDPDAAVRLRPRRRRQAGLRRLDVLDARTTPSARPASSRSPPASAIATTSPPSTGARPRRRPPRARAT